jgi:hypothetical protein
LIGRAVWRDFDGPSGEIASDFGMPESLTLASLPASAPLPPLPPLPEEPALPAVPPPPVLPPVAPAAPPAPALPPAPPADAVDPAAPPVVPPPAPPAPPPLDVELAGEPEEVSSDPQPKAKATTKPPNQAIRMGARLANSVPKC